MASQSESCGRPRNNGRGCWGKEKPRARPGFPGSNPERLELQTPVGPGEARERFAIGSRRAGHLWSLSHSGLRPWQA
jgi:hypothetical protein